MTAARDIHETSSEAGTPARLTSRHRADGSTSAPTWFSSRRKLAALAVVPAAVVSILSFLTVLALVHASHAPLLRGKTLAAIVMLGIAVLTVFPTGFVCAARLAQAPDTGAEQSGAAARAEASPAASSARPDTTDTEVLVHLSRRLQSLVHNQIGELDNLENVVEDPDLLKAVFSVDHLATMMRRLAENLAVLGGAVPRRQWTNPVPLTTVLRSAVSETRDYPRVQVIVSGSAALNGFVIADVVHLLAELVENATKFSPPEAKVVLRTQKVAAGLAIEIDDRGLGLTPETYESLNALLRDPTSISIHRLIQGGRIGLYVVAQLARRHRIIVQLDRNVTGGTQALVVLPTSLLATDPAAGPAHMAGTQVPAAAPGPAVPPAADSADSASSTTRLAPGALPAPRRAGNGQGATNGPGISTAPAAHVPFSQVPMGAAQGLRPTPSPAPHGNARTYGSVPTPGERVLPPLPHRQPQQHLAPGLTDQASVNPEGRVSEGGFEPSLMAGFRRGMAEGHQQPISEGYPDEHTPTEEGR